MIDGVCGVCVICYVEKTFFVVVVFFFLSFWFNPPDAVYFLCRESTRMDLLEGSWDR